MLVFHRRALAGVGITAAAAASTALFATPAQAATAGLAKVVGSSTVQFNALMGQANGLTITISGRTVTLDDKVAIQAGPGCKAVRGDKTKVTCTPARKVTQITAALGDKNDWITNKTSVPLLADGGAGDDVLTGGSGNDELLGGPGNDIISGGGGDDLLVGEAGNDRIGGGAGKDSILGGAGNDVISGGAGNDSVLGGAGNDVISGDADADTVLGEDGNDRIDGGAGNDILLGDAGNDVILGGAGDDSLFGESLTKGGKQTGSDSAADRLDGGANGTPAGDFCLVMASGTTANCESGIIGTPAAIAGASAAPVAEFKAETAARVARQDIAAVAAAE